MKKKKLTGIASLLLTAAFSCFTLSIWLLFARNIRTNGEIITLYIPEGSSYTQVLDSLKVHFTIEHPRVFNWIAERKHYPSLIKPGRFVIDEDISYTGLIDLLRSGEQMPVNVTFNNIRTISDLAGKIGGQLSADSAELAGFFSEPENYSEDGFTRETIMTVFIPNTYQFFWNTSAEGFYRRMLKEYNEFWNNGRKAQAAAIGLTPPEVSVLASIVDEEASKTDEKPRIAGVYLNRLRRGIPLQADPTVIFAHGDFGITRVLKAHLQIDSPYNTYKYRGLPPGPINSPSISGIDAVLNAEKHDFLYFSAKPDFSGYHNFSRTLSEHNRYAAEYHRELNRRRIFR
ncbi:MAG: endolytic transglycosylase MltG [Bacteroidales bacterium]|nr:endolytic transglycosylase MltG [Bacteroidales bacterium]